nr:hypothetical protein [Tanacetum cinerariifolium]
MLLYIKGKQHGKLLVDSVLNGPFQYETIIEPGNENTPATVKARTYTNLTDEEKICELVDIKVTNIVLQGLPQDTYNLINNKKHAKQIRDRVKLLIQGSKLSLQEGQARVVKSYNYQEEGHFARQCTKPKRPKNSTWFKEKMLLTEALESGAYLDLKQLAFLADNKDIVTLAQATQGIPSPAAFQIDNLDAFDYTFDDAPSVKAVLMANHSSYDSDILLDVPFHNTNIENVMSYQSMQETQCLKQPSFDNDIEVDIKSDSNIISYEQYFQETENLVVQSISSSTQQDELLMSSQVAKLPNTEETLDLAEESRLKMLAKQNDPSLKDKKVDFTPVNYVALNKLSEHFVPQKQLSVEHAFWLPISEPIFKKPSVSSEPVSKKKIPHELPSISLNIICQDVMTNVMHANDHSDNVLPTNNNSLEHDNSESKLLKHKNDHLTELLISKDLVHTAVNSLAVINDYKSMQQSFVDEYNETLVLKANLAKNHDMIEKAVYNELLKRCSR